MTVRFHSDNIGTDTGFLAKWEEVTTVINTNSNVIASPNYPDNYFNEDSKVH